MPPAIDYRQTFLGRHIPTELDPPFVQEPGFREEILALDSLRHRLLQAFPAAVAEIHQLASRRRFFRAMPDDEPWLYLPVRVRSLASDGREYDDLTDLLCSAADGRLGVLLTARSGAGKSTAMLKAYFDCLDGRDPKLGGWLPCYLRQLHSSRKAFVRARKDKAADHEMILDLLAEAARLPSSPSAERLEHERLEQWLRYSPPLLLFLDLNAASNELRPVFAEAIVRFQEHFDDRHRWVVAYRSAGRDDTLNYLQQTGRFGAYDLQHLKYTDAERYLGNLRRVEDELRRELAARHAPAADRPADTAPIDPAMLRDLFGRYGNDPNGLISTPLLMHFVSVIGLERAAGVESLAQLYDEIIEDYLDRDYGRLDGTPTTPYAEVVRRSGLTNPAGRTKIKTAMARAALAILAAGGGTRLQPPDRRTPVEEVVDRLLGGPEDFRDPDWRPADAWWHEGRYYHEPFDEPACRALREFSFLRRDGDAFGFLHDSFLYYFAALAVRCRKEPILKFSPLTAEWHRKAVERMHGSPESWRLPALFLGGMLTPEELKTLLPPLLTAEPAAGWFGVVSQVVSGRRQPTGQEDVVLRQMEWALRSRASELDRCPEALFPHVYNYLSWCEEPQAACHVWAEGILGPAMNATGRPWLRAETPMPPPVGQIFRCDSDARCLAIYAAGEFITGHEDGSVRRWWVETGKNQVLCRHGDEVHSVAVDTRDGSVVSGGDDGAVRRWLPASARADVLYRHNGSVSSVATGPEVGEVLSGGSDRTIRRWLPQEGTATVLHKVGPGPVFVAVDARSGAVYSGDHDGAVRRWMPGRSRARILYRHERRVNCMTVDPRDGSVLSGGGDGAVRRWLPGRSEAEIISKHLVQVNAILADNRDGAILSTGVSGEVRRWRPELGDVRVSQWHEEGRIKAVAVDERDDAVLSLVEDGTVRRVAPGEPDRARLYEYGRDVASVAVDTRDGTVLSGGAYDNAVCRRSPSEVDDVVLYKHVLDHPGMVVSVALDPRAGVVVSGGWDDAVRRWAPGRPETDILYRHDGVHSVAMDLRDGAVYSGGGDGKIRRWVPGQSEADVIFPDATCDSPPQPGQEPQEDDDAWKRLIRSVAVNAQDGEVFWGGGDGMLRCWKPGGAVGALFRQGQAITSVVVDVHTGGLLWSAYDAVYQWLPDDSEADLLYRHEGCVVSMAVDEYVECLLSGGHDANLRLFRLDHGDLLALLTPFSIRSIACSLRHNRIALALGDGRLVLVRVEPSVEALLSYPAQRKNLPPDA